MDYIEGNYKWERTFLDDSNDISRTMQNYSLLIFSFSFLATGTYVFQFSCSPVNLTHYSIFLQRLS